MSKAWAAGIGVLAVACGTWFLLLRLEVYSPAVAIGLWFSPMVAGFAASYLAPRRKILVGTCMALPAALFAALLNLLSQYSGQAVDFPGLEGGFILFALTLIGSTVLSALGAFLAYLLATRRKETG
jgi:hypothetical protein